MFSSEWFQTVIKGFFNLQMDLKHSLSVQNDFNTCIWDMSHPFCRFDPSIFPSRPSYISNNWRFLLKWSHWETHWLFIWGLAAFHHVLRFTHTHCTPRNETQRWCSMCVNIDCVSSGLYCALPHLGFVSMMFLLIQYGSSRFCYIVQYAVHKSFALRNTFLIFFGCFIGTLLFQ